MTSQCDYHCKCCKIGPSMLASDLSSLASDAKAVLAAGADELHLDVMDGHFVPNITFGAPVIQCLRKNVPDAFFDCHMMVSKPSQWVEDVAKAGGNRYCFHLEAVDTDVVDVIQLCALIRTNGMEVGIALKPGTSLDALRSFVSLVDMVLIMTVEPGFGGQKFQPNMMPKVLALRTEYPLLDIQVDGGLSEATIDVAAKAGANIIVSGSGVFGKPDMRVPVMNMRRSVEKYGNGKGEKELSELK